MSESVLPSALAWIGRGHAVFPLWWPTEHNGQRVCACGRLCGRDAGKHPVGRCVPHGVHDATLETGIAKLWFGLRVPESNLGVSTDRLVVIDVDVRDGAGGDESLAALEREHGPLPTTWRSITGSGGEHIFFAAPADVEIHNVVAKIMTDPPLGRGIDVRAKNGYVVAPPSRHISGGVYAWSVDHHPSETPLAPTPEWLVKRLTTVKGVSTMGMPIAPIPSDVWAQLTRQPITEYHGHVAARIAGHLLRHNVDIELAAGLLHSWNSAWCRPPLGYHELNDLFSRICNREAARIEAELRRKR
jgi:hypothetical protein